MLLSVFGFALTGIGLFLRSIGERGLAGSGVVLDPEKARQEMEPLSKMTGGIIKDTLEETDINLGAKPERVIMVKCPSCGKLNEENAKFCQECGKEI